MKGGMLAWLMWLVSLLVSIGIGGLFVNGSLTEVAILSFLPLIVHQIVGWIIIVGAVWGTIAQATK